MKLPPHDPQGPSRGAGSQAPRVESRMTSYDPTEERVVPHERFQAVRSDFEAKAFSPIDHCEFVKCRLLLHEATEYLPSLLAFSKTAISISWMRIQNAG